MKIRRHHHVAEWLLTAGLAFGALSAQAAGGYTILQQQERMISAGMSTQEVQRHLGIPIAQVRYLGEGGPTWTYFVTDVVSAFPNTTQVVLFDVSFDADGRVVSASERTVTKDSSLSD